jgi:peroxiredoxin
LISLCGKVGWIPCKSRKPFKPDPIEPNSWLPTSLSVDDRSFVEGRYRVDTHRRWVVRSPDLGIWESSRAQYKDGPAFYRHITSVIQLMELMHVIYGKVGLHSSTCDTGPTIRRPPGARYSERRPSMGLQQQLDKFRAEFARTAPATRAALYEAEIEELRASFASEQALGVGKKAADFSLPDAHGYPVSLFKILQGGPAIAAFFRGGWCPYCALQLRAYPAALPKIEKLIAISPQLPDGSLSAADKNEFAFDVLSDIGNTVARAYGLVYTLPEELSAAMRSYEKELPKINGDESWQLPVTASYVIAPDSRITLAFIDVDYRRRLAPEDVLTALASLRPGWPRRNSTVPRQRKPSRRRLTANAQNRGKLP